MGEETRPIATTLALTMTRGMSLAAWRRAGLLHREWALYEALAALGAFERIVLFTYGDPTEEAALARELAPQPFVAALDASASPLEQRRQAADLARKTLADDKRVVVKTNQFEGGDVAVAVARAAREIGAHTALVARGGYLWSRFCAWEHGADSPQARSAARAEAQLLAQADLAIATTRAMADDLAWRHSLPKRRLRVVPNYIVAHEAADFQRQALHAERENGLILTAGRFVAQKRVDLLIRAVAALAQRGVEAQLRIVGEGPLEPALRALARELAAPVEFLPRMEQEELLDQMRRCAVYAQVSAYEGHPKTVLEAMAQGCAVALAEQAPGLSDIAQHGRTAWLAPPAPEAIADALQRLLADESLRERLGAAACARVLETCSLDRVAQLEAQALREALELALREPRQAPSLQVRWPAELLTAPLAEQLRAWRDSLHGFQKRLAPRDRVRFLLGLDDPLYQMQGLAAVEAEGGLHPKHRLTRYHDFFVERVRRGERVLDLGCGSGALACALAKRAGACVTGVDIDQAAVESAAQRARRLGVEDLTRFLVGDILELDRLLDQDEAFETLALSNVLEHLPQRPALLAKLLTRRRFRQLLLRVPSFERDWRVPFKRELDVEWRLDPTHEIEHTREQLARELDEAGLAPVEWLCLWGEHWVRAVPANAV